MFHPLRDFLREIAEDFKYFHMLVTKGDPDWRARKKRPVSPEEIRELLEKERDQAKRPPSDGSS